VDFRSQEEINIILGWGIDEEYLGNMFAIQMT
jgi:hypothetical protein